ncbi:MAG: hypothetical protein O2950_09580 [Proteobacteria bacterium]|nr:hypothetical protein [Pseudomonadota bacterium]MDA1352518.1 hypothetical protein [Pseudomonadota bacterium]
MNKNLKPALAIAFLAGYFVSDITNDIGINIISNVTADVAGMDYYDLKGDYAFKKAVMSIAEEECRTDLRFKAENYFGSF